MPDGVQELTALGHTVLIETEAGELSGFRDEELRAAGAEIVKSLADVWNRCELLVKVKEPAPEEVQFFRPGLAVFSFLHLAVAPQLPKAMAQSGVTGLDYDLVMLDDGRLPILEPMSVIAGKLSIQCGAYALQAGNGGRGVLIGGSVGVKPARVTVIGAGAAGSNAATVAIGMGAEVSVLDINPMRLIPFSERTYRCRALYSSGANIQREVKDSDLVIGSVLVPGTLAPKLISRELLGRMKRGSVMVDICIDQGGFAESSRPTTITEPTYLDSGVVHYCVPNMPALVPRTSTEALTAASLPWVKLIAERGVQGALKTSLPMRRSLTSYRGHLTNSIIGEAVKLPAIAEDQITALIG